MDREETRQFRTHREQVTASMTAAAKLRLTMKAMEWANDFAYFEADGLLSALESMITERGGSVLPSPESILADDQADPSPIPDLKIVDDNPEGLGFHAPDPNKENEE